MKLYHVTPKITYDTYIKFNGLKPILGRADTINDISYKVAKLPTGEMTPGTTVIEMKNGEISRIRKAYEK